MRSIVLSYRAFSQLTLQFQRFDEIQYLESLRSNILYKLLIMKEVIIADSKEEEQKYYVCTEVKGFLQQRFSQTRFLSARLCRNSKKYHCRNKIDTFLRQQQVNMRTILDKINRTVSFYSLIYSSHSTFLCPRLRFHNFYAGFPSPAPDVVTWGSLISSQRHKIRSSLALYLRPKECVDSLDEIEIGLWLLTGRIRDSSGEGKCILGIFSTK